MVNVSEGKTSQRRDKKRKKCNEHQKEEQLVAPSRRFPIRLLCLFGSGVGRSVAALGRPEGLEQTLDHFYKPRQVQERRCAFRESPEKTGV